MPRAAYKWHKQCARKSTEQRIHAKDRLLGVSTPEPTSCFVPQYPTWGTGQLIGNGYPSYYQPLWIGNQQMAHPDQLQTLTNAYTVNTLPITFTVANNQYNWGGAVPLSPLTEQAWGGWNDNYRAQPLITTAGTYQNVVWDRWVNVPPAPLTPEEAAAQVAANEQYQRDYEQRRREQEVNNARIRETAQAAFDKALALFLSILKPEERETYDKEKCIYVRGSRGRRYRIRCNHSQAGNVEWVNEKGEGVAHLCCHPAEMVPAPDAWMVQKLTLEHDEDHFTGLANYSGRRRPAPDELIAA